MKPATAVGLGCVIPHTAGFAAFGFASLNGILEIKHAWKGFVFVSSHILLYFVSKSASPKKGVDWKAFVESF